MAGRWELHRVRDALEVGSGVGHWCFALAQVLPAEARLTGLDREPEWVRRSTQAARDRGLGERFQFEQGSVERLPYLEASFDLVTCQTLLMHVGDPVGALREMVRVLRPGGLLLAVEPANRAAQALCGSLEGTPDRLAERLRFFLTCERGKVVCGEGDNSIGDRVPGLFAALGLRQVIVRQWEHAAPLIPPYDAPDQQAQIADLRSWVRRGMWMCDRETAERYFLAGGGAAGRFEEGWRQALAASAEVLEAIDAGTYHGGGGSVVYVVWARKA
jgi:SAM-dependent methyltransferase